MNRIPGADQVWRLNLNVRHQRAQVEFEHPEVAVARVVGRGPGARGCGEIIPSATARAHRLVHRAVFVKARGAAVHVFVRKRPAEVGSVRQVRPVRCEHPQPKITPVRAKLERAFGRGQSTGGGLGSIGAVGRVRLTAPTADVHLVAIGNQEGRRADVDAGHGQSNAGDKLGGLQVLTQPHNEGAAVGVGIVHLAHEGHVAAHGLAAEVRAVIGVELYEIRLVVIVCTEIGRG